MTPALRTAHRIDPDSLHGVIVLGPSLRYVTEPHDGEPCVLLGTIPPGIEVPLHSHADVETFSLVAGGLEALTVRGRDDFEWVTLRPGDTWHVPGDAPHAFRNRAAEPAVTLITTTARLGRFFREVGTPIRSGMRPPSATTDIVERFLAVSARYGYWNAPPDENARVGIVVPPPSGGSG
jgi:quercetin dioxygenase-like cupin family protein